MNAVADLTVCPSLIPGVRVWPFFPASASEHALYIVGQQDVDRYVVVPGHAVWVIERVVELFDGAHSLAWIEQHLRNSERTQIDVARLYGEFARAGLIASSDVSVQKSDLEAMMLGVVQVRLASISGGIRRALRPVIQWTAVLGALVILWGTWVCIYESGMSWRSDSWGRGDSLVTAGFMIVSFVAHECGHGLAAAYFGLSPRSIKAALYLGIFPFIYLRLGGLYTLSPSKRVIVWLAGIYTNLIIASSLVLAIRYGGLNPDVISVTRYVLVGNYMLALVNLFPFLPTDGYYVATTLLRTYNLRGRALASLRTILRGRRPSDSKWVLVYLIASIATVSSLIVHQLSRAAESDTYAAYKISTGLLFIALSFSTKVFESPVSRTARNAITTIRWVGVASGLYLSGVLTALTRSAWALLSTL